MVIGFFMHVKKILILLFCFLFASLAYGIELQPIGKLPDKPFAHTIEFETTGEIRAHMVGGQYRFWAPDLNWSNLEKLYKSRNYQPLWLNNGYPTQRAHTARDEILNAYLDGLDSNEYHSDALRYMWNARRPVTKARLDILLSDAFLRYAQELKAGYFNPQSVDFDWKLPGKKINPINILNAFLDSNDAEIFLKGLAPKHPEYVALKKALFKYRKIAAQGGWKRIKRGTTLKPGDQGNRVKDLRHRLISEGYLSDSNLLLGFEDIYESTLEEAVRKYQLANGLEVDGLIGGATLRNINTGINQRITEIKKNMERWRWLPDDLGQKYVMVNMAGYDLQMVVNEQSVLEMPVVVGKKTRPTPTFIDTMEYVEVNPTWKIPPRIAKEKFLPKLQEDPKFLKANRLKVYNGWHKSAKEVDPETINWSHYSENRWFPFKLEQSPGKHNSLGQIKFMFPNKYRIYLHDTPEKNLFAKQVRTYSAGCVRVSNPYELAGRMLQADGNWSAEKIKKLVDAGETQRIPLKNKWPVYLMYWTAWVDDSGIVNFRKDVYQRNKMIASGPEPDYNNIVLAQNSF